MLIPGAAGSLPIINNLQDCADYYKTVHPYIAHFYTSPTTALSQLSNIPWTDTAALKHLYLTTNPLTSALAFAIATFPIFFIVTEANKNYSQVDRVWSILPTLFNTHYAVWAHLNGLPTQKVDNVLAFSVLWSLRLTFNYWRKGGYQVGSEDYRWLIIKKYIGSAGFFVLNVTFISTLQILILLAITTPTYILLLTSRLSPTLTPTAVVISRSLICLIVLEYFADQQQWNYHIAKHDYQRTAKPPAGWSRAQMDRGFNTTGLWKYSRHPNFAAEQTIWVVLYIWGCYESETWYNWTAIGAVSYLLVFQGSTPITEWISQGKYPEYKTYRQRVGRFVPNLLFGKGWDEKELDGNWAKSMDEEKKRKEEGGGPKAMHRL